ncbi:MAG: PilZ domain-containing protein [Planctomycetota bacterium]
MNAQDRVRDVLRLSSDLERELLSARSDRTVAAGQSRRRHARRLFAEHSRCVLVEIGADRSESAFVSIPFDISEGGIGLLHGRYVAPQTTCRVLLRDLEGNAHDLRGTVHRCSLLEGRVHEIGVALSATVDPARFTTAEASIPVTVDPTLERIAELGQELTDLARNHAEAAPILALIEELTKLGEQCAAPADEPHAEGDDVATSEDQDASEPAEP